MSVRSSPGDDAATAPPELAEHIDRLDRDGFTVLEDAFSPVLAEQLSTDIDRLEAAGEVEPADDDSEGRRAMVWDRT